MERCPCCKARLNGSSQCPRCSTDLSHAVRCGQLAKYWLAKSVQLLAESETELAIAALEHSLRYQKTPLAMVFKRFLNS